MSKTFSIGLLLCICTLGNAMPAGNFRNTSRNSKVTSRSLKFDPELSQESPFPLTNLTEDAMEVIASLKNDLLSSDVNSLTDSEDSDESHASGSVNYPRVNLTSGLWNGKWLEVPELQTGVETFFGVRYAQPPVGDLRFKHPMPIAYIGERNATVMGPACIQRDEFFIRRNMSYRFHPMSEDCLHLNIYKPKNARGLPIALHFFGGSFYGGYNGHYIHDPEQLVAQEKVIVVTANYRVGPLGFLYLNSSHAPGNAGIYDMLLAARFIKQNAEALGGDPEKLTLWGQSAGAIAVSMLMSSPLAEGLFNRAILQSGSAPSAALSLHMNSASNGIYAASVLGCRSSADEVDERDIDEIATCMKLIDGKKFFDTLQSAAGDQFLVNFQAMAGIDDLIPEYPFRGAQSKLNAGIEEVLIGTIQNEGGMFANSAMERAGYDTPSAENFLALAWFMLKSVLSVPAHFVRRAVFTYIRDDSEDVEELQDSMSALLGDVLFECPADLYSTFMDNQGVKVYRYMWAHRPSTSAWPEYIGPTHYDDIGFTMGSQLHIKDRAETSGQASHGFLDCFSRGITEAEESLLRESLSMIGNFLRTGSPSIPFSPLYPWPQYQEDGRDTIRINLLNSTLMHGPKSHHCQVWKSFLSNS
ncbi:cholinesterase 1-like [Galendromus occidentalis]|uniref:Cholinesterase 1-like n=1 Tax=Galendromus occidentalis TaxID=34638 RepID=A0AAJ6VYX2_9ACAR|nr:cholinesterase 1-like [Galendromus occidentalis]